MNTNAMIEIPVMIVPTAYHFGVIGLIASCVLMYVEMTPVPRATKLVLINSPQARTNPKTAAETTSHLINGSVTRRKTLNGDARSTLAARS